MKYNIFFLGQRWTKNTTKTLALVSVASCGMKISHFSSCNLSKTEENATSKTKSWRKQLFAGKNLHSSKRSSLLIICFAQSLVRIADAEQNGCVRTTAVGTAAGRAHIRGIRGTSRRLRPRFEYLTKTSTEPCAFNSFPVYYTSVRWPHTKPRFCHKTCSKISLVLAWPHHKLRFVNRPVSRLLQYLILICWGNMPQFEMTAC